MFGAVLFAIALVCSAMVGLASFLISLAIIIMTFIYNGIGKQSNLFGPITMGLCRSGNLLLGMSLIPESIPAFWPVALIPLLFISAVTLTAQGEVAGNNKTTIAWAILLDIITAGALLLICFYYEGSLVQLSLFLLIWLGGNLFFKSKAISHNTPAQVMKAVKMGVISIIVLDACYVAAFGQWKVALGLSLLLPLAIIIAKKIKVT
ncbi:MAG: hypothetical protein AAFO03_13780 [Bacteroidota bacterium]